MSKKDHQSSSSKKSKDNVVMKYVSHTVLYTAISLLFIVPICMVMLNFAVNIVHRVQPTFSPQVSDIVISDESFTPSDKITGTVTLPELKAGNKVGELSCDEKGLFTDVYYGSNRKSFQHGSGLVAGESKPGTGGTVHIKGSVSKGFGALENLEIGDIITFTTSWGVYEYSVEDCSVAVAPAELEDDEVLVLETQSTRDAFSNYREDNLFVTAKLISGPSAEEVQS